jgi:hypothetical protein
VFVAFQHYLVMLGTTVIIPTIIVPLMGGGHVSLPPASLRRCYIHTYTHTHTHTPHVSLSVFAWNENEH